MVHSGSDVSTSAAEACQNTSAKVSVANCGSGREGYVYGTQNCEMGVGVFSKKGTLLRVMRVVIPIKLSPYLKIKEYS